ncbi:MAG TPA: response regulator [Chloroflexota bacterium]|nr:response regulator [Chloroflexota bacterium]
MATVLIVEDDASLRALLHDFLAAACLDSVGIECLGQIERTRLPLYPDLVIVDLLFHDGSGVEATAGLRRLGLDDIPAIALTSSHFASREVRDAGYFAAVLEKPFDLDDFLAVVSRLVPDQPNRFEREDHPERLVARQRR